MSTDTPKAMILLIEDNPADQEMTRRALAKANPDVTLEVVDDGEQALDFLLRRDVYAADETPVPQLVLLDLNLPKLSGKEIIRSVRGHDQLKHMPLIVLTTSPAEEDILESYRLGCNSYLTKPNRFDEFVGVMQQLTHYWFSSVRLPHNQG